MSKLLKTRVCSVRRRLFAGRMLAVLPWCATAAFLAAAGVIALDKYRLLGSFPVGASWQMVLGAAAVVAVVAAMVWSWIRRGDELSAAVELDRRCGLYERVSSALAVAAAPTDDAAAEAVRADAERAVAKLDVAKNFPIVASRRLAWPLLPLAAALSLALWLAPAGPTPTPPTAQAAVDEKAQVKENAESLERQFDLAKQEAERLKLVEAQKLLEKLQEEARQLTKAADVDRKEALVKLNDLAKQLEERRKQVEPADGLKKQLARLRAKDKGPADKFSDALRQGDYHEAIDQLQQLREQMKSEKLDDAQKQALAKQLDQLEKQLKEMAEAREKQRDAMEKQLAERRDQAQDEKPGDGQKKEGGKQDGNKDGTDEPGADLAELSQQLAQMAAENDQLKSLEQAMSGAADAMQHGDSKQAQQALDQLRDQLDDLARENDEMQLLDQGLNDLAQCKNGMCQGQGQQQGQGQGQKQGAGQGGQPGQDQQAAGRQNGGDQQGGSAPGVGVGNKLGEPPSPDKTAGGFDSRVTQQVKPGEFRMIGPADGPNAKGRVLDAIREQADALPTAADAQTVDRQTLDRSRRDQKKQYFDSLRTGR